MEKISYLTASPKARRWLWYVLPVLLSMLLAGCRPAVSPPTATALPTQRSNVTPTATNLPTVPQPSATRTFAPSPSPTLTPTPQPAATQTPTPDPYADLTIMGLAGRAYDGGALEIIDTLATNSYFTRYIFRYTSDGLAIYGFLNLPIQAQTALETPPAGGASTPRIPVIIALHGYIDPAIYQTVDYTTRYADALARAGFIVLHPNLRGYPPSDDGDNRFRAGMAVDVLNLIALVRQQAGQPGPLEYADPEAIGLWGHSMGGGIATRVMTVDRGVKAVVLYGAMGADEQKNYERIYYYFSAGAMGREELDTPTEAVERISPVNYLERVQASVSIHHGKDDVDVPLAWSLDLCNRLRKLGKTVECYTYADQPHTFHDDGDALFIQRTIDFFSRTFSLNR